MANGENASLFKLQASLENVQEFRVESSGYPAEFGTGTGGQVSVITKSGGNQFRGSVFEYLRNDRFDAANYFDSQRNADGSIIAKAGSASTVPKSPLKLNQFGGSVGGPIVEGSRVLLRQLRRLSARRRQELHSGACRAPRRGRRAVPAIAALAARVHGAGRRTFCRARRPTRTSTSAQWQATQEVTRKRVQRRAWTSGSTTTGRRTSACSTTRPRASIPQDVSGRFFHMTINPTNAIFNLQGILGGGTINEFKFGYNAAAEHGGRRARSLGSRTSRISLQRQRGQHRHRRPGSSSPLASPGGLVRVNSAGNGRGAPYNPYSLTFADSLSRVMGKHYIEGGRRRPTDPDDHRSARRHHLHVPNVTAFLANTPTQVQYFGDLSEPSPFHNGATGLKHIEQEYYVGYAQDEWRVRHELHAELRPPLRLLRAAEGDRQPDRQVQHRHRPARSGHDAVLPVEEEQLPAARSRRPIRSRRRPCVKGGVGIFVGPGQTEDQIQPIEAERISTTLSSGPLLAYPVDPAAIRPNFTNNPNNRSYQPRAYSDDYTLPEKVYQYTASVQREIGGGMAASAAYVGSQGRNLFLRSIANQIVGVQIERRHRRARRCASSTS